MAIRRARALCEQCGAKYVKCRFNKHHQRYCTRKSCIIRRRQERQRQYYRRTYRNDKEFADAERERCKNNIRKRREYLRKSNDEKLSGSPLIPINIDLLATGLLSQWIDSKDPMEVEQAARQLETRGRQLTLTVVSTGSAPDVKDFQTVPLHSLEG